ncbi:MAG TPA: rhodanese-like domain-containing protein [Chloroflexota bacterium]|nr:rhodanese-like domain-containing protein [Chloroflexota bacterium]
MSTASQGNPSEPYVRVDVPTARNLIENEAIRIIDVREPHEYAEGHIPGVKLVPLNTLLSRPTEFITEDNILFVCAMGQRSAVACEMAAAIGMEKIYNLEGGTTAWAKAGLPIER